MQMFWSAGEALGSPNSGTLTKADSPCRVYRLDPERCLLCRVGDPAFLDDGEVGELVRGQGSGRAQVHDPPAAEGADAGEEPAMAAGPVGLRAHHGGAAVPRQALEHPEARLELLARHVVL